MTDTSRNSTLCIMARNECCPVVVDRVQSLELNCHECASGYKLAVERTRSQPIAPYQALPVTGPSVISHHLTPALPVLEPGEDAEVRQDLGRVDVLDILLFIAQLTLRSSAGFR